MVTLFWDVGLNKRQFEQRTKDFGEDKGMEISRTKKQQTHSIRFMLSLHFFNSLLIPIG